MSTKIYNGCRINTRSVRTLMEVLAETGKRYDKALHRRITVAQAELAARALDLVVLKDHKVLLDTFGPISAGSNPAQIAHKYVREQHEEVYKTGHRNPGFDFGLSITVIPSTGCFLALHYAEQRELRECFTKISLVEEFPYWNNVDQPDGMTGKQWRERGRIWDKALGGRTPAQSGLSRDYFTCIPYPTFEEVAQAAPSRAARANELGNCRVLNERMRSLVKGKGIESSEVMRLYDQAREWLKTDQGRATLAKETARIHEAIQTVTPGLLRASLLS